MAAAGCRSALGQSVVAPAIGLEIDPPVDAEDAFHAEALELLDRQVRRRCAIGAQHAVPRVTLVGKLRKYEPGEPGRVRAGAGRDIAVGGNPADRNAGDNVKHPLGQIHIHVHE